MRTKRRAPYYPPLLRSSAPHHPSTDASFSERAASQMSLKSKTREAVSTLSTSRLNRIKNDDDDVYYPRGRRPREDK